MRVGGSDKCFFGVRRYGRAKKIFAAFRVLRSSFRGSVKSHLFGGNGRDEMRMYCTCARDYRPPTPCRGWLPEPVALERSSAGRRGRFSQDGPRERGRL